MGNLEMHDRVIKLGKALVSELNADSGVDTLTRWIAHYIAELLVNIESHEGDEKTEAEKRCFEAILTLWHHRSCYKDGHRPFENFEPIFRVLESLNPEESKNFYLRSVLNSPKSLENDTDYVSGWIDTLGKIDELARLLISYSLQKATVEAADKETIDWLNNSISLICNDDLGVIIKLIESSSIANKIDALKNDTLDSEKTLKIKLQRINELSSVCDLVGADIVKELKSLESLK